MVTAQMATSENGIRYLGRASSPLGAWHGSPDLIAFHPADIKSKLLNLDQPCYVVRLNGQIGVTHEGTLSQNGNGRSREAEVLASHGAFPARQLGDPGFRSFHGVRYAYATGAMAGAIASEELVIALGRDRLLGSFGAGGVPPARLEAAIQRIQNALPQGICAFNLIHSPNEAALERGAVELYLKYGVRTIEASAFMDLTPYVVRYRAAGLSLNNANEIQINNKVIAKVSRREVATKFLHPAPARILKELVSAGLITEQQAILAEKVPMADDLTVEADSGGHTDNRPLVCLLPSLMALRDEIQAEYGFAHRVRVGAAGGIGTPEAALAAFMMGADYVVTGSINQSCVESGASTYTKGVLAQAEMADVMMAPAADMFELGVKLQVLKRGTLFPVRAQTLYELYKNYDSIEAIPAKERESIERQIFRRNLDTVWDDTVSFFKQRDPDQIDRAANNPKRKMALIFRWYLGLSSRWSSIGEKGREIDYQIWCGPAMGSFNDWVRGSYLADPKNRRVVDVANHLMIGAAYLYRIQNLKAQSLFLPAAYSQYVPEAI